MPYTELIRQFDKRMASASEGLQEGLHWGEIIDSGGSPAPLLSLHTSHPSDQASCSSGQHPCLNMLLKQDLLRCLHSLKECG